MPIYEYICLDCKKEFETLRTFNEADKPMACDACSGENVKRKLSVFYAQSGGHAVSGMSAGVDCGSCSSGNCAGCGC